MTHGSLFSGIGGFDLGAERAGLQNLWACEIDEFKQQILHKHFPDTHIYSDIKTINPPYVDVISGGFPCQDISQSQGKFKNNLRMQTRSQVYGANRMGNQQIKTNKEIK